jgi:cytochrome c oxidase assembly protein subunit 15
MEEFSLYQASPEHDQRKAMELPEFKVIYYWEWGHRMLGRTAGVIFIAPFAYFAVRRMVPAGYYPRFFTLLAMGGTQGLIGWWMVKSGLGDDRRGDKKEIRVSPYRLATHLSTAFATYSVCLWTGLDLLHPRDAMVKAGEMVAKNKDMLVNLSKLKTLRLLSLGATSVFALTAASGAFVAGNDAGNAYNDWPMMNGSFVPEDMIDESLDPQWRNAFESTGMVQFDHRMLAYSSAAAAAAVVGYSRHLIPLKVLTPQAQKAILLAGGVVTLQVGLGISTLMLYVPVGLAAAHQLGSLALLSTGIYMVHSLRYVGVAAARNAAAMKGGVGAGSASTIKQGVKLAQMKY